MGLASHIHLQLSLGDYKMGLASHIHLQHSLGDYKMGLASHIHLQHSLGDYKMGLASHIHLQLSLAHKNIILNLNKKVKKFTPLLYCYVTLNSPLGKLHEYNLCHELVSVYS